MTSGSIEFFSPSQLEAGYIDNESIVKRRETNYLYKYLITRISPHFIFFTDQPPLRCRFVPVVNSSRVATKRYLQSLPNHSFLFFLQPFFNFSLSLSPSLYFAGKDPSTPFLGSGNKTENNEFIDFAGRRGCICVCKDR